MSESVALIILVILAWVAGAVGAASIQRGGYQPRANPPRRLTKPGGRP